MPKNRKTKLELIKDLVPDIVSEDDRIWYCDQNSRPLGEDYYPGYKWNSQPMIAQIEFSNYVSFIAKREVFYEQVREIMQDSRLLVSIKRITFFCTGAEIEGWINVGYYGHKRSGDSVSWLDVGWKYFRNVILYGNLDIDDICNVYPPENDSLETLKDLLFALDVFD